MFYVAISRVQTEVRVQRAGETTTTVPYADMLLDERSGALSRLWPRHPS